MMDTSLRRGSPNVRHLDIVKTYEEVLELSPEEFAAYTPKNTLQQMVKVSIQRALEDPSSGEAHRIYNRLIGKPRETSVQITGRVDLTQSGLYQALTQIRSQYSDVKELPSIEEERRALEFKNSKWAPQEKISAQNEERLARIKAKKDEPLDRFLNKGDNHA
jgi:hypothetical protein